MALKTRKNLSGEINIPECISLDINKSNNLNFLRLVFAYIVVMHHSMRLPGYEYLIGGEILFDGHIAVCGFLIIRSYWSSNSLKNYYIKRCKRLLPAYYFVIITSAIGLSLLSNLPIIEYFKSPRLIKYFVANIFFMNFLQPSLPGVFIKNNIAAVNGSLWTIKLEIAFYVVVPIIAYILDKCKTKKRMNILLACLYVIGYIYNLVGLYISNKLTNEFVGEAIFQLTGFCSYFLVGIFCAINYGVIRRYDRYIIMPAIGIVVLYYIFGNEFLLPIGLGIIIMYISFNFSKLNNIGKNGDYSYGVYIFHFPLIQILITLGFFEINKNAVLLLVLGTVFSMAYLSWHFLEKKVLKR
jgi:peptidoglycan/LPS O-acetylase OafA/YrhL